MPTFSAASCTETALPESSERFASTTFSKTSGTAFCFRTKYFVFSAIVSPLCVFHRNTSVFTVKI